MGQSSFLWARYLQEDLSYRFIDNSQSLAYTWCSVKTCEITEVIWVSRERAIIKRSCVRQPPKMFAIVELELRARLLNFFFLRSVFDLDPF